MRWWSSSAVGWLWLATIAATACSNPTPGPCECVGDVPGGELDAACGETQCVAGTLYECTGRNTAAARGPCGPEANLRPAGALLRIGKTELVGLDHGTVVACVPPFSDDGQLEDRRARFISHAV